MGFPTWTLWGMGIAGFAALLAMTFAYIAQSPDLAKRFRRIAPRLIRRSRRLTGLGLSGLLVMLGFFMAGAPIDSLNTETGQEIMVITATIDPVEVQAAVATEIARFNAEAAANGLAVADTTTGSSDDSLLLEPTEPAMQQSESGAFVRPATRDDGQEATVTFTPTPSTDQAAAVSGTPTFTPTPSNTPTPTQTPTPSNTPTPSPSPTATPSPTLTPTPITAPTVGIREGFSLVRVRQTPGGEILQLVVRGTPLLLEDLQAPYENQIWQQVRTVEGVLGWVLLEELDLTASGE